MEPMIDRLMVLSEEEMEHVGHCCPSSVINDLAYAITHANKPDGYRSEILEVLKEVYPKLRVIENKYLGPPMA